MKSTLDAFASIGTPGTIVDLPYRWLADDAWKDRVMRPQGDSKGGTAEHEDDRIERFDTPQYQSPQDKPADESHCPTCVFLEDTPR